jgi:hypothetical protein
MYDANSDPDAPDSSYTDEGAEFAQREVNQADLVPDPVDSRSRRRPVLRRRWLPFEINGSAMLAIFVLIGLTIFLILNNQRLLTDEVLMWWPLAITIPSVLWFLNAILRRRPNGMMASATLAGFGLSLMLAQQHIAPFGATVVGITFVAAGAGVMLRGLLLSNQPVA